MTQLRNVNNRLLPARAGKSSGMEITSEMRRAGLVALGVRGSVAQAMSVGLITKSVRG